jgi:sec-independent protein translocase protein TatA
MELAIVLVVALIIFGPKRLPELGRSLGKGIREFRQSVSHSGSDDDEPPRELQPGDTAGGGESQSRQETSTHS